MFESRAAGLQRVLHIIPFEDFFGHLFFRFAERFNVDQAPIILDNPHFCIIIHEYYMIHA